MTPTISLKKLKTCQGGDGIAFSAELHVDGKLAAYARDDGNGGSIFIEWTPTRKPGKSIWESDVKDRLEAWCATQPPCDYGDFTMPLDIETLINREIDRMEEEKQLRRWCRTQVVFRVEGDKEGEWHLLKVKFAGNEARVRAQLGRDYGDKLVEIVNERF
jgi:hypothetical protein